MVKIYKIVDRTNGNIYIGKTDKKYLSERLAIHINDFKRGHYCSSSMILKNNDYYTELIEETEDHTRERYWILNSNCVNKVIPGGNVNEWKKRWRDKNKEKINNKTFENRDKHNQYKRDLYKYQNSWGGDKRNNNNLLEIDTDIFTS